MNPINFQFSCTKLNLFRDEPRIIEIKDEMLLIKKVDYSERNKLFLGSENSKWIWNLLQVKSSVANREKFEWINCDKWISSPSWASSKKIFWSPWRLDKVNIVFKLLNKGLKIYSEDESCITKWLIFTSHLKLLGKELLQKYKKKFFFHNIY